MTMIIFADIDIAHWAYVQFSLTELDSLLYLLFCLCGFILFISDI